MTMDMLIDLIFLGLIFWLGWTLRGWLLIKVMSDSPEKMIDILKEVQRINREEQQAKDEPKQVNPTELRIERHQDMLYAFTTERDEFIAQGSTLDELLEKARHRFPNKVFIGTITADNPAKELA